MTIWSRSMIQEYGENYLNVDHTHEPSPHPLQPWSILSMSTATKSQVDVHLEDGSEKMLPLSLSSDLNIAQSSSETFSNQDTKGEKGTLDQDENSSKTDAGSCPKDLATKVFQFFRYLRHADYSPPISIEFRVSDLIAKIGGIYSEGGLSRHFTCQ